MAEAGAAIYALLTGIGSPALVAGLDLLQVPEVLQDEGVPHRAVFVVENGGGQNEPIIGASGSVQRASVIVTVRADQYGYADGLTLAKACLTAVHRGSASGWPYCVSRSPSPTYVGRDDRFCHAWQIDVELMRST